MVLNDAQHAVRRVNYIVLMFAMLLSAAVMGAIIFLLTQAIGSANEQARPSLVRLAWVAVACLGFDVIVLLWIFLRWMRLRISPTPPLPDAPYQDAWSEAGKRVQVDPDDPVTEEDEQTPPWRE